MRAGKNIIRDLLKEPDWGRIKSILNCDLKNNYTQVEEGEAVF